MLAAAINYVGLVEEQKLGHMLLNLLEGFTVIKICPSENKKEARLQLCQPEGYEDLQKDIQKYQDAAGKLLEFHGPRAKLQRVVRYMFFFDEERKHDKVLLEGCDGITDFPWAVQIVMVQPPVPGGEQEPEWLRKADVLILDDSERQQVRDFIARVKTIRPDIPVFTEKVREGLSQGLKDRLESLFNAYMEKRWSIKEILRLQHPEQQISCVKANDMAKRLKVSTHLVGSVCDELGYSITNCGLGCF